MAQADSPNGLERPKAKTSTSHPPQIFRHGDQPMKIHITLGCPTRSTFTKMVEEHGGKITALSNQAEIRIGDHLKKKNTDLDLVSYKWIEECCSKGELVDVEDHRIRLAETKPGVPKKHVGPLARTSRRNEFTAEEDRMLIDYLKQQHAKGSSLNGTRIYRALAALYPRHTEQSWRDHWTKSLKHRADVLAEVYGENSNTTDSPTQQVGFSREQDDIILKAIMQPGADPEDPAFWARLEATHIKHCIPAASWRKRYEVRLKPELDKYTRPKETGPGKDAPVPTSQPEPEPEPEPEPQHDEEEPRETSEPSEIPRQNVPQNKEIRPRASTAAPHPPQSPETDSTPQKASSVPPRLRAPIPKPPVFKTPVTTSKERLVHSNLVPTHSRKSFPPESTPIRETPTSRSWRRVTNPLVRVNRPSPITTNPDRKRSLGATLSPVLGEEIIYQDPKRRTTIWRSPKAHRDVDDEITHEQLQSAEQPTKTNRIRVSLGDINIEIESNEGSPIVGFTPRMQSTPHVGHSPPLERAIEGNGTGMSSRRATGGEIPSTPGSSPVKLKSESSLRDQEGEMMEQHADGGYGLELEFGEVEPMAVGEELPENRGHEVEEPEEEEEMRDDHGIGLEIENIGPDTQAAFEEDAMSPIEVPDIDLATPPPKEHQPQQPKFPSPKVTRFFENIDDWVESKAMKYDIDTEMVRYFLERTGGRPKLTQRVIRMYAENPRTVDLSQIRGYWTEAEDDALKTANDAHLLQHLDEKHGFNASVQRKEFLQTWNRAAMKNARTKWVR